MGLENNEFKRQQFATTSMFLFSIPLLHNLTNKLLSPQRSCRGAKANEQRRGLGIISISEKSHPIPSRNSDSSSALPAPSPPYSARRYILPLLYLQVYPTSPSDAHAYSNEPREEERGCSRVRSSSFNTKLSSPYLVAAHLSMPTSKTSTEFQPKQILNQPGLSAL